MQITYQPAVGAPVTVRGIFDANYVLARGTAEAGVETLGPAVFLILSDLPVDPEIDDPTVIISLDPVSANNGPYRVHERRPAGLGAIVLALRKVV
jgi:hypothetical protein